MTDPRPGELDEPHGVAVSPDGRHWYATLAHGEPTLWKFETDGDRLVGRVPLPLPGAARIRLTPDGRLGFVPDYWRSGEGRESSVAVVRLEDLSVVRTLEVCPAPHDAPVTPAGDRVALTCSLGDEVVILDRESLEVEARFPVDPDPGPPGRPRFKPLNGVWSPDGEILYVSLAQAGQVRAFDSGGRLLGTVDAGDGPTQVAITLDGARLVVAGRGSGSLRVVDAVSLRPERTISLPDAPHPHGVALSGYGTTAFVTYEGTVQEPGGVLAVDLGSGEVLWRREAGFYTLGIAVGPPAG